MDTKNGVLSDLSRPLAGGKKMASELENVPLSECEEEDEDDKDDGEVGKDNDKDNGKKSDEGCDGILVTQQQREGAPFSSLVADNQVSTASLSDNCGGKLKDADNDERASEEKGDLSSGPLPTAAAAKDENGWDRTDVDMLMKKVQEMEDERGRMVGQLLDKELAAIKREKELESAKEELDQQATLHQAQLSEALAQQEWLEKELNQKIAELKKLFVSANKDKEAMVMKYAMRERDILVQSKAREEADKKCQLALKDKEDAVAKMKSAVADRNKFQLVADSRLQDIQVLKREVERWKEEVKVQEAKSAASAGRLRQEVEAHREVKEQLESTIRNLGETRAEIEKARKECSDFMDKVRQDEGEKQRLAKEQSVKLIIDAAAANELEAARAKLAKASEDNGSLNLKLIKAESENMELKEALAAEREALTSRDREVDELLAQVAEAESLRSKLASGAKRAKELEAEAERLKDDLSESQGIAQASKNKEAELLDFAAKMTERNVTLQSDVESLTCKVDGLEAERLAREAATGEIKARLDAVLDELRTEKGLRAKETGVLAKKLAEKTKEAAVLSQQAIDSENEVQVLRRKHASSIRELRRELQHVSKRGLACPSSGETLPLPPRLPGRANEEAQTCCDGNDDNDGSRLSSLPMPNSDRQEVLSRSSSNSSLNRLPEHPDPHKVVSNGDSISIASSSSSSNHNYGTNPRLFCPDNLAATCSPPDSQMLVEKIVRLQRDLARRQEKMDFMEEHVGTLVEELQKKNRLIQSYLLNQEAGALVSSEMDENKLLFARSLIEKALVDERKLSEHGGIMSSLYSSKANDAGMTLELSLEINKKLQAVLEDTLLKNITLKENINTLGNEIANMACKR